ncbi:mitochondrial basic amino acids transporter [Athalia rosae]|uniref:mitochondrial basic amino acids transporter n=1 Tax=Athalia rosae TaxID=37344 RepID=UPI0020339302|nr:mitochondrial basic amino acids transporter [Athalia rosae]XP_048505783.1 mitochondrial basic amino acids transporter [Athalia rosae]XP_048505785.1 mitochondrial basic amino acids transporter [Athalia rosae]
MALDFAAGCLGGCAGVMVGYPLDTIKVHLQTQDYRNPKYTGTWHCFRTILARDSMAGLYRGMSSPMVGVAFVNAIIFGVYGNTQRNFSEPDALYSHLLAGATAGIAQSPVCSPMELAKTRLQLQSASSAAKYSGPMECLRYIHRKEGYRGTFKGLGMTFLREAPGFGIYFLTYEALTRSNSPTPISTFQMLMAGGLAGTASWIISYPMDVIKSRLQAEVTGKYSGAMDCLRQSISAEGYACLFRGLNSTIIRAFPTNAATFAVVTWTFRLLGEAPTPAPEVKKQPSVAHKEPARRLSKPENGLLTQWQTAVTNMVTDAHNSRSYSTLSAVGFDSNLPGPSSLAVAHEQIVESKKVVDGEPGDTTDEQKYQRLSQEVQEGTQQNDQNSCTKDESGQAANPSTGLELVFVVDRLSAPFEELEKNS